MRIIDTHCHLDFKDFDTDREQIIARAEEAGVIRIVNVASSIDGSRRSVDLAEKYGMIYASVGVHPHEAKAVTDEALGTLKKLSGNKKVVAIGEVGLDYYRNLSPKEEQIGVFKKFIHLAIDTGLPLILHSREAGDDLLDILQKECGNRVKGVMHCFAGDKAFLKRCLDLGLYVSFTCNLTFKNARPLREVAKEMPLERLLLETDAPFLAPQEVRGKRNEPAYLTGLVDEWARISGLSAEDISRITTHNANKLFGLGLDEGPAQIAYRIRDSLYLNITNRCTGSCDFCTRNKSDFVKGHNLRLDYEPSEEEIQRAVSAHDGCREVVFCGFGEPTLRLDLIKSLCSRFKKSGLKVRLVTNGHGDLINERPIAGELARCIDKVSVSLNVDTEEEYNRICAPQFGPVTYKAIIGFIGSCVKNGIETEVTCLDLEGVDPARCEKIASELGARFRSRRLGMVG